LSYFLCAAECKSWRFTFRFPNQWPVYTFMEGHTSYSVSRLVKCI
jgi:hypothetical protein